MYKYFAKQLQIWLGNELHSILLCNIWYAILNKFSPVLVFHNVNTVCRYICFSTDGETTDGDTDKELDGIISGAKVYNGVGISKGGKFNIYRRID